MLDKYTVLINKQNPVSKDFYKNYEIMETSGVENDIVKIEKLTFEKYENLKKYLNKTENIEIGILNAYRDFNEQEKTLYLKPDIGLWDDNNRDGIIIFQSLKGVKPNFYVAPQYINETSYPLFKNKRYDNKTFLRYYQIACEHNIYFSQFWPLQKLGENIDKVMSFIEYLFKSHHDKFSQNDYLNLQRFADEFVFDWLLLPYDKWKMLFKRYQDNIKVLFKHTALARNTSEKDYLITLLDSYFLIKPKSWKHVRNTTMKCIGVYTKGGVYKKNKEFALLDNDYSKRIEIMKKILSSETNIIRTLVEDINKQQKQ